jgi:PIN domain nuclease of toxin-antitoxin system
MRYLLDTHVLLWWLVDPDKLTSKARDIIEDKANTIFISSVSIWEMTIKKDLGKLNIPNNILAVIRSEGIQFLSLSAEECLGLVDLPKLHNDPFDRMLIIQAKFNDLVMITKDPQILEYPVIAVKA